MAPSSPVASPNISAADCAFAAERARLVRLCAHLSGDVDAAEDLAQETLLEAWRNRNKLGETADTEGRAKWLSAVARNVCRRWWRTQGREAAHRTVSVGGGASSEPALEGTLEATLAADSDVELALEREELAALLDRALAYLPEETRTVLLERFVRELPHGEIAAQLGVSEEVVAQRIHRGKLLLRRVLTTDLRDEAVSFGLAPAQLQARVEADEWQETRLWCPFCGVSHLSYRIAGETGEVTFRCAGDCANPIRQICGHGSAYGLASPKSILNRNLLDRHLAYRAGLARGTSPCLQCRRPAPVVTHFSDDLDIPERLRELRGLYIACPACGPTDSASLWHLLLDHPATQPFWRAHPRIRALPIREVEADGQPAFISGFESATGSGRLEIVSARDSLGVLGIYRTP